MLQCKSYFSLLCLILTFFLTACSGRVVENSFDKDIASKARVELALGYLSMGDFTQAKRNLDKAYAYAPNSAFVASSYAYFYQRQGENQKAEHFYQKAIQADKQQGDIKNNYAVFLCETGRFAQAQEQFKLALESKDYYNQLDTYENIAVCAHYAKDDALYQQYWQILQNISPKRAENLQQKLRDKPKNSQRKGEP